VTKDRDWDPEAVAAELRRDEEMAQSYRDQHRADARRDGIRSASVDMSAAEELVAFLLKSSASLRSRETFLEKLEELRADPDLADDWQGVFDRRAFRPKLRDYIDRLVRKYS
jgi:hypothetical protein